MEKYERAHGLHPLFLYSREVLQGCLLLSLHPVSHLHGEERKTLVLKTRFWLWPGKEHLISILSPQTKHSFRNEDNEFYVAMCFTTYSFSFLNVRVW